MIATLRMLSTTTMAVLGRIVWMCILATGAVMAMNAPSRAFPVIDPDTLHSYLIVEPEDWPDAKEAAEAFSEPGRVCHLATITSPEESQFIQDKVLSGDGELWIGGERRSECPDSEDNEAFWGKWVTGEPWSYTNWADGAPDECDDDCLVLIAGEDDDVLQDQGSGAQVPTEAAWDEDDCDEAFPYLVECEPRLGTPVLSGASLISLAALMVVASWWILRRRQGRTAQPTV